MLFSFFVSCLYIFPSFFTVLQDRAHLFAFFYLGTAAAGFHPILQRANTDLAERFAIGRFHTVDPTTHAVDHLRRDLHTVEFTPLFCYPLSQFVIVFDRCDPGVALFTIQSAVGDVFFHLFE